jgi:hypothetical protein
MSPEYDEQNDDEFDAMLKTHFASELDPELGRARGAFEEHVARRDAAVRSPQPFRVRGWMIGVVGTALAASIAAVWAVPTVWRGETKPLVNDTPGVSRPAVLTASHAGAGLLPVAAKWEQVSAAVSCVSQNKGVVLLGNEMPARVVQQNEIELREYVCPTQGVRVEIAMPRQTTRLIALETH